MSTTTRRLFVSSLLGLVLTLTAADWPQFRGPAGGGVSDDRDLPVTWSTSENIVWKTELPGAGRSSPIIVGNRIFLTCFSGYGLNETDPGKQEDLRRTVLCLDRASGRILWKKQVESKLPENAYKGYQTQHGYASSTPAADNDRVVVFFGKTGVLAFDHDGNQVWQSEVGSSTHQWGSGTSPILYKDLVIVNASVESSSLVALDKKTGKQVWQASGIKQSWSTPLLVELEGGKHEVVISMRGSILSFDPDTGKQLWQCEGIQDYVCPSMVAQHGVVYAIGGRKGGTAVAVRAGGRGDVTGTHRLWEKRTGSNVPSPVLHDGHLFWVDDGGIAHCMKADSGEEVYKERLSGAGRVYASALAADGKLFIVSREKGTFVLAAGPKFEQLAHNSIDSDPSIFDACPAVSNGRLLIRSDQFLYCIGAK